MEIDGDGKSAFRSPRCVFRLPHRPYRGHRRWFAPIATFRRRAIEIEIAVIGQKCGLAAPQTAVRLTQRGMKTDLTGGKATQFDAARHINHGIVRRYHDSRPPRLL